MLSYLRFMKCADTDQQLLELHTEVNELRTKIHNLDQMTASEMLVTVEFTESTYESYGFPDFKIESNTERHFKQSISVADIKKTIKPRKSKYIGVSFSTPIGKWVSSVRHKGTTHNHSCHNTEEQAIIRRDETIIKYHLPLDLQILKKDTK